MVIYHTNFSLTNRVIDFAAAKAYLTYYDMTEYVPDTLKDNVEHVEWTLTDEQSGYIEVRTFSPFTETERKEMSEWIRGQNSDGLGEGFEQADFACYGGDYGCDVVASFDWNINFYALTEVSRTDYEADVKMAIECYKKALEMKRKAEALIGFAMCNNAEGYNLYSKKYLQMYSGIEDFARRIGAEPKERERYGGGKEKFVEYCGYEWMQIADEDGTYR